MSELDGWTYTDEPRGTGDNRKLCTLEQDGMVWVGIRIWASALKRWQSNGEPCPSEKVLAWRDLPAPARGFWDRGKLCLAPSGSGEQ